MNHDFNRTVEADEAFESLRGRFTRITFLRQSGFSHVLRAREEGSKRDVAIKVVRYDSFRHNNIPEWLLQHIVHEAQRAKCTQFRHVVNLYDVCVGKAAIVLVMEYCADTDLERILRDSPPYVSEEAYLESFLVQMITGAIEMTRAGLCCRTIGTENVLLQRRTHGPPIFKISDMGMTKHLVCIASWAASLHSVDTEEHEGEEDGPAHSNGILLYSPSPSSSPSCLDDAACWSDYTHQPQTITPAYIASLGGILQRMLGTAEQDPASVAEPFSMVDISRRMTNADDATTLLHVMDWLCSGRRLAAVPTIWTSFIQERCTMFAHQMPRFARLPFSVVAERICASDDALTPTDDDDAMTMIGSLLGALANSKAKEGASVEVTADSLWAKAMQSSDLRDAR